MIRLFKVLLILLISSTLQAQKGTLRTTIFTGISLQYNSQANTKMDEWLLKDYPVTRWVTIFIDIPITEKPLVIRTMDNEIPFGVDLVMNATNVLGIGIEYEQYNVLLTTNIIGSPIKLIYNHEGYKFMPKFIIHPNPKALKNAGFDLHFELGVGFSKSEIKCTTQIRNEIVNEDIEIGSPVSWKIAAGIAYFPIPWAGAKIEFGTGSTNFRFGLVFKTSNRRAEKK